MRPGLAFWSILQKDMRNYYLKPPNISWGIIFPVSWSLMFILRSATPVDIRDLLPGVMALVMRKGLFTCISKRKWI